MLKLLHCYHGRLLILVALLAAAFIANRKVVLLWTYASAISGIDQSAGKVLAPASEKEEGIVPAPCKALRVIAGDSELQFAHDRTPCNAVPLFVMTFPPLNHLREAASTGPPLVGLFPQEFSVLRI